ncbi:Methylated-DNA--protein-cysteine methyltransferase [Tetrabaena socialis]|uniref:Methylated-DNA--protein-cysteine methyltransferase n=1 Tax=Tetrabaena socialis TaxID=47790 RepID=A0A2J8A5Z1_9CHLO|nr:Methylated-DNA--protein-cysteine methyltransferase [Tetrabaena socialis]|eukprot:PNH07928.1 Methylated-DNA--protein-cysteine methyltransferase [Tetrabaena socialis]
MAKRKRAERTEDAGKPNRPPTEFEERLYQLCKCIPAGKVSTYGALSAVLKSSPRAVGQALRRNPFAPVVPCHRVVASDMEIGGFSGGWGVSDPNVQRKRKLLEEEGIEFDGSVVRRTAALNAEELGRLLAEAK